MVLFLILLGSFAFAEENVNETCRTELGVLKDCNDSHKKDQTHWVCYKATKENNNECFNQDATYYKCDFGSKLRICEGYSPHDMIENPSYEPKKRLIPANQQSGANR